MSKHTHKEATYCTKEYLFCVSILFGCDEPRFRQRRAQHAPDEIGYFLPKASGGTLIIEVVKFVCFWAVALWAQSSLDLGAAVVRFAPES